MITEEDITIALLTDGEYDIDRDEFNENLPVLLKAKLCYIGNFYMSEDQYVFDIKFPNTKLKVSNGWPISRVARYYYDDPIGKEVRGFPRGMFKCK